jgi:hypothetical protein
MQEGTHIVCDELDTLVVMDQITRDGFDSGIPGLVFPEEYMRVVPMGAKHDEEGLFEEAHTLKKELSRVPLLSTQDRVFTDCRMMIVVLNEERHADCVLLWNRQHMVRAFFEFYREGGNVNTNVLRTHRDKGETSSKKGEV